MPEGFIISTGIGSMGGLGEFVDFAAFSKETAQKWIEAERASKGTLSEFPLEIVSIGDVKFVQGVNARINLHPSVRPVSG